ncbi:MAG: hypothetical protein WDZ52_02505 [Pseudohongiellaceae bacterium]
MQPVFTMRFDNALFVFSNTAQHLPQIDEWLCGDPHELFAIARQWFSEFRQCGADVGELLHDVCPTICSPTICSPTICSPTICIDGAAFAYVNVYQNPVNIGFFTGVFLNDP